MENQSLNLYQRIRAVMQDVEYLGKDDSVGSGNYAYKAISEEKVTQTVRVSLIKNGLVIFPVEQVHTQKDHVREGGKIVPITTVDVKYKIVNIDNPEEFEILASSGTGVDPQDKGVGKAMTYSYKYLFLRTFALPTGEDPDKVHNNDLDKQQKPAPKSAEQTAPNPANEPATDKQKEQIVKLIQSHVFTEEEQSKVLDKVESYSKVAAMKVIENVTKTLNERKAKEKQAATAA